MVKVAYGYTEHYHTFSDDFYSHKLMCLNAYIYTNKITIKKDCSITCKKKER